MGNGDERPIRKGDRGFLFRLLGGFAVVTLLAVLLLGLLDHLVDQCVLHGQLLELLVHFAVEVSCRSLTRPRPTSFRRPVGVESEACSTL